MLASGIVNPAANGGTKVAEEASLESDLKDDPTVQKFADPLKNAFADQLKAVSFTLKIHWCLIASEYIPLHENIAKHFVDMQTGVAPAIETIDLTERPLLGEIPLTKLKEFDRQPTPAVEQA
jgi:DNA-binding ferritin-like protein